MMKPRQKKIEINLLKATQQDGKAWIPSQVSLVCSIPALVQDTTLHPCYFFTHLSLADGGWAL